MARTTGRGGRHAQRKPDGDANAKRAKSQAEPFQTNQEAYSEGLRLLGELRKLRGVYHTRIDEPFAESLISYYLERLRATGWSVALYGVLRLAHLDGERLVVVLLVLAGWYGHVQTPMLREAMALAAGFEPIRIRSLSTWATREGQHLYIDDKTRLWPTRRLVETASGAAPISDQEVAWFKEALAKMPTKEKPEQKGEL